MVLLLTSVFTACNSEPRTEVASMEFAIDPSLLGTPVEAVPLGIGFQPPAGWAPLSAADLDSVSHALSGNALEIQHHHVFAHPDNRSILSVATVGERSTRTLEEQVTRYAAVLAAQQTDTPVQQGEYLKDGIHIVQFLVQAKGYVTFTLFFTSSKGEMVRLDYITPRDVYPDQI